MLQWEEEVRRGTSFSEGKYNQGTSEAQLKKNSYLGEVAIIYWPHGKIMRLPSGSTAADAARRMGLEGQLILVNGQLIYPHTELKDGDIVEVRL
jgi:(p)ppGpp synthase/HD superfamily hydrolase